MQNRFLLVADSGLMDDGIREEESGEEGLLEKIENEQPFKGLQKLTDKQLQILEMIYVKDYSIKVIAETLQTTSQNISNVHQKALKKLHHIIRKEEI